MREQADIVGYLLLLYSSVQQHSFSKKMGSAVFVQTIVVYICNTVTIMITVLKSDDCWLVMVTAVAV